MDPILRHVAACNNAVLPGGRLPFRVSGAPVGFVTPAFAVRLGGEGLDVDAARLPGLACALAAEGTFRWRGEAFDVRSDPDGPVVAQVDRGALPSFGIGAVGVHLNAMVRRDGELWLWVARRAADKLLDPGKLDHLVAGGVPAGLSPWEALVKEADEEAGLPPGLVAGAREVGTIDYAMDRPEGLRRDRLHCYDLVLPESFVPEARDGEVAGFELWRPGGRAGVRAGHGRVQVQREPGADRPVPAAGDAGGGRRVGLRGGSVVAVSRGHRP